MISLLLPVQFVLIHGGGDDVNAEKREKINTSLDYKLFTKYFFKGGLARRIALLRGCVTKFPYPDIYRRKIPTLW